VLFRSAAAVYGPGTLAVVLTGMGSDGMLGCRTIREHGGAVIAQDQASSTVWGMPGAVTNAGLAHRVLSLGDIAPEILRLISRTHSEASELRESMV
jgi:two-component system chemotaxis response regulator CheB